MNAGVPRNDPIRLPDAAIDFLLDEDVRFGDVTMRALGIGDKVSFAGFVSQNELRELFYRSHIFLHPSERGADGNQEGVPNSMLEAMASGLAVFATEHGGIPEAIEHGKSGILVKESDHAALARTLLDAATTPDALTAIARGGAEAVRQKFEQTAQTWKLEEYYFEVIGRQPA